MCTGRHVLRTTQNLRVLGIMLSTDVLLPVFWFTPEGTSYFVIQDQAFPSDVLHLAKLRKTYGSVDYF